MNDNDIQRETDDRDDAFNARASSQASSGVAAVRGTLIGVFVGVVLFGVLLPLRTKQRETARRTSCQSNLKQIGLAYLQYITDYDEKYPRLWMDGDRSGRFDSLRDTGWAQNIGPYLKAPQLFQCPSEPSRGDLRGGIAPNYSDYWMNARMSGRSEAEMENPQRTVKLGDGLNGTAAQAFDASHRLPPEAQSRHLQGLNLAFGDGYVKWYTPGALSDAPTTHSSVTFSLK
jgi:hypothetical protein